MDKIILKGVLQRFGDYKSNGRIYPQNVIDTYFKRFKRKSKIKSLLREKY
jgi:hypothetical protein